MERIRIHSDELCLSTLTDEQVLFFIRNLGKESYFREYYPPSLLTQFKSLRDYHTISEYRRDATIYIDLKRYKYSDLSTQEKQTLSGVLHLDEIIKRCRALRAISYGAAKELVYRCAKFFLHLYSSREVKLIVCGTVDNYVMDVMVRVGRSFGVKFIGITNSFMSPMYKLVSLYGEHNLMRPHIKEEEVEQVHQMLAGRYKSSMATSKAKAIRFATRAVVSYLYRLVFRYGVQYKMLRRWEYEYQFAPMFGGMEAIENALAASPFTSSLDVERIRNNRSTNVYIPLHYYPEATLDYWTDEPEMSDYLHGLIDVITFFREAGMHVILKEHPASYLLRPKGFYSALTDLENVTLLDPFIETRAVFAAVQYVVVWNGSTGIEALLAGKCVSVVTESYYSAGQLPHYTNFRHGRPFSDKERFELIRRILQTSLPT